MMKYKNMRCNKWTMISVVLFFIGVVMYIYPRITNLLSQEYTQVTIEAFEEIVQTMQIPEAIPETAVVQTSLQKEVTLLDELLIKVKEYNKDLYEEGQKELVDPFSYEVSSFDLSDYGIDDNMFGYIEIPKMNSVMGIYLGATAENMSKGAVHLTQTSLPIGGSNTNTVIAAHRGSRYGDRFLNIDKLKIGNEVKITNAWETLIYSVTSIAIIAPNEIDKVLIQDGRDMVTLISCNPYGRNTQRYVVYCDRVADK